MKNEEMMVGGLFLHFDGNKNDVSIKNLGCAMNGFVVEGNVIIYIFYVWVWMKNEEMMVGGSFSSF